MTNEEVEKFWERLLSGSSDSAAECRRLLLDDLVTGAEPSVPENRTDDNLREIFE